MELFKNINILSLEQAIVLPDMGTSEHRYGLVMKALKQNKKEK